MICSKQRTSSTVNRRNKLRSSHEADPLGRLGRDADATYASSFEIAGRVAEQAKLQISDSSITGSMVEIDQNDLPTNFPIDVVYSNFGGSLRYVDVRTGSGDDEVTHDSNQSGQPIPVNTGLGG